MRPAVSSRQPIAKSSILKASAALSQSRTTSTSTVVSKDEANSILAAQRLKRPISPHLAIYKLQLTSGLSVSHRITGAILSGGIYVYALAYLASPMLGWHLESATIAAAFGALPLAAKVGIKGLVALPFTYHSLNGVRHLLWDTGKSLDIKGVYKTGYVVLGLTAASTIYLATL
ncbi:hypothetical protein RUND412_001266 [Rhizina undulata]